MSFVRRSFLLLLFVSLFTTTGQAVVVDWDTLTWTPGTLTNSYDVDPAKTGNDNGNVTISFGTTAIKSFTFTYGSGSGTVADPTYQQVGIHDITFTVPELNPTWTAVGSCLVAFALILRHSAKFRK